MAVKVPRRTRLRIWTASDKTEISKNTLSSDDGLKDRPCSSTASAETATAAVRETAAYGMAVFRDVASSGTFDQSTTRASCKQTNPAPTVCP
jgi:hypothetical protein